MTPWPPEMWGKQVIGLFSPCSEFHSRWNDNFYLRNLMKRQLLSSKFNEMTTFIFGIQCICFRTKFYNAKGKKGLRDLWLSIKNIANKFRGQWLILCWGGPTHLAKIFVMKRYIFQIWLNTCLTMTFRLRSSKTPRILPKSRLSWKIVIRACRVLACKKNNGMTSLSWKIVQCCEGKNGHNFFCNKCVVFASYCKFAN